MTTALTLLAVAALYLLCAAICRACNGCGDAQEESERDASWWRGLDLPGDGR